MWIVPIRVSEWPCSPSLDSGHMKGMSISGVKSVGGTAGRASRNPAPTRGALAAMIVTYASRYIRPMRASSRRNRRSSSSHPHRRVMSKCVTLRWRRLQCALRRQRRRHPRPRRKNPRQCVRIHCLSVLYGSVMPVAGVAVPAVSVGILRDSVNLRVISKYCSSTNVWYLLLNGS